MGRDIYINGVCPAYRVTLVCMANREILVHNVKSSLMSYIRHANSSV